MAEPAGPAATVAEVTAPGVDETDAGFALIDKHLRRHRFAQDQLIETLHIAQDVFGHLPDDVLTHVGRALKLPPSMVYGVASFYHSFTFDPPGEHTCTVCTGTVCFVKGADAIVAAIADTHRVSPGSTSTDGRLTLATARCLGSCGLAPMVLVDGQVRGHETVESALGELSRLLTDPDPEPAADSGPATERAS